MPLNDTPAPPSDSHDGVTRPAAPPPAAGRWGSLERRLPLLISALLLLVVLAYGWATYAEVRASSVDAGRQHLQVVAHQLAEISQTGIASRWATLRRLAADSALVRALRGGDTAAAAALLARAVPPADSVHLAWELWSADGVRRLALGQPSGARDLAALREAGAIALRGDAIEHSPFYVGGGRIYSWTATPVTVDGRRLGYLAERRRLANARRTEEAIRGLTGQNVRVFFTSRGSDVWAAIDGRPVPAPFALPAGRETFAARAPDGTVQRGAQVGVQGTPYTIVLALPEAAVLLRSHAFLRRMLVTGLGVLVIGALGAWLLSRHVTRPLRAVTDAADAVAAGDYGHRLTVRRRDELGRLAATFNVMALRIGESHTELARRVQHSSALAEELERRNEELRASQEQTLRAVRRTERLQDVTAALAGALEFDRVVSVILRAGLEAAEAAACEIFIVDPDQTTLTLVRTEHTDAVPPPQRRAISLDSPRPIAEAARTGRAQYIESREQWLALPGGAPDPEAEAGHGRAALPLVARGRTLGTIGLRFAGPVAFDAETRAFLGALAQQCAQALDRALLYDAAVHARNAAEQARHVAQSANQAKTAFLAMMSHELRTPLNAIGGYTELLELGIRGPLTEPQREDLVRIRRNQQHLLSIINDILNMSRIEAGQIAIQLADVPVGAVLGELESLAGPQIATKGLRYEVRHCDDGTAVRADAEKLNQVLLNLVSNAVRFTEPGGAITVSCDADADAVYLRVADTGIGIPPEKLEVIFRPFVQVDDRLTRRTGGTGLGLAIARNLMTAMGGRIAVESEVGRGSTFTLVLPRAHAPARASAVR
jgi:signal transduction histidine kinase